MSNKEKAIVVIIVLALSLAIIALLAPSPANGGTFISPILDKHSYLPLIQCESLCPTARPTPTSIFPTDTPTARPTLPAPTPSETPKVSPTPTKLLPTT